MTVFLISEDKIKAGGIIPQNFDGSYLSGVILCAQDLYLQQVIGTSLYEDIKTRVANGAVTAQYKKLLDEYIHPYLLQTIYADVQVSIFAKFRNAGVVQVNEQQTNSLTRADVEYLRDYYKRQAEFYRLRLDSYLCANKNLYPSYRAESTAADLRPSHDKPRNGIYLGL